MLLLSPPLTKVAPDRILSEDLNAGQKIASICIEKPFADTPLICEANSCSIGLVMVRTTQSARIPAVRYVSKGGFMGVAYPGWYNQQRLHSCVGLLVARGVCTDTSGDTCIRKVSAGMLEQGIEAPSPLQTHCNVNGGLTFGNGTVNGAHQSLFKEDLCCR